MHLKDLLEGNESIISCDESEESVDNEDHKRAVECLTGLSDDDKVILNRFSNIQWIQGEVWRKHMIWLGSCSDDVEEP